jgi:hypothetical protein
MGKRRTQIGGRADGVEPFGVGPAEHTANATHFDF